MKRLEREISETRRKVGWGEQGRFYGWIMGSTKRSINARTSAQAINSNKYAGETFSINAINFVFILFAPGYSVFQSKSRSSIIIYSVVERNKISGNQFENAASRIN
jgi:hypothetical protein